MEEDEFERQHSTITYDVVLRKVCIISLSVAKLTKRRNPEK